MKIYEKITDWIIPALLLALLETISRMQTDIAEVAKSLAVMAELVKEHDDRINGLEEYWRHK